MSVIFRCTARIVTFAAAGLHAQSGARKPAPQIGKSQTTVIHSPSKPGAGPAAGAAPPAMSGPKAQQYKIETSTDCKSFTTIPDETKNDVTKYTEFEELPPTRCRFVRLTMTGWPHSGNSPLGIMEFTVFGKALAQSK